jgi:hypothetical protein
MAASTCVKCGNDSFEAVEAMPAGSEHPVTLVQCASCGGVVGVHDGIEAGRLTRQQNTAIHKLARQFGMSLELDQ